jgi:hypothetical protein
MASELNQPAPHAAAYTSGFPVTLPIPARGGLLLSNFAAGAASVTLTTVGGESVTIALGTTAVGNVPVYLPIQAAIINAVANVGTVVALWH